MYAVRSTQPTTIACPVVTSPLGLRAQSVCDYKGDNHPDGWGVGWYEPGGPRVERGELAASADSGFAAAAQHVASTLALAHVRKASVGVVRPENVHPFVYGPWMFAHNGTVYEYPQLSERLADETAPDLQAHRHGTTDSQQMFFWLLTRIRAAGHDLLRPQAAADLLAGYVAQAVAEVIRRAQAANPASETALNFLLTDGQSVVATRWRRTLWMAEFSADWRCGECGRAHAAATSAAAVVIASQPTSHDAWKELSDGDVVAVASDLTVTRTRLDV